jgi:hypothetical protein
MSEQPSLIEVAGVTHEDPLGFGRLKRWLLGLGFSAKYEPAFVAVEYDIIHLSRIVAQRPSFGELVKQEWPFLCPEEYAMLEKSLGYEGDAHVDLFPNAETVWLDEGRQGSGIETALQTFAERRMEVLRLSAQSIPQQRKAFLPLLSQNVWAQAKANRLSRGDDRDRRFADMITARASNQSWDRAIVIVGASHTRQEVSDSFVRRVEAAGIICRITILECSG